MKDDKKVPQLRFPEFTDAWKQRKFGDVLVSIQTGTNKLGSDRNSGQPLLKMGNLQSGYFDLSKLEFLENKAEPENIVKQGDFFFNTRNTLELVGKGATWFGESNKYAFNSNIARFTLKDVNTGFFNYLYNTNYVKKQIRARAMGTTSVAAIYPRSLKSVDIVIPNMEEQIKLSNLFMNLDSTITLQQRKLNSLQKLKKGLLQKMFPKNGENIPEIRFPEFSDAWKQRKLSDIALIVGGGTPSTNNPEYWDGEIDWYAPAEINGQIYADYSARKITKLGLEKSSAKILPAGKTVLFTSRAGIGKTAILRRPAATNQGFQSLVLNDEIDTYFVYSMTEIIKQKAEKIASGSTFAEISGKMLGGLSFMFPKYTEQNKIGTFFSKLDNLITLQQRWLFYTHKQS